MVSEVVRLEHHHQFVDHVRVEDVVHWNPAEKGVEGLETRTDQGRFGLVGIFED